MSRNFRKRVGLSFLALMLFCVGGSFAAGFYCQPCLADSRTFADEELAEKSIAKAEWVFENASAVQYKHYKHPAAEQVRYIDGVLSCRNDCSGFIAYIMESVSPRHYEVISRLQPERPYPQAKTFARFFAGLSPSESRDGWLRVASYRDLRKGDFIAWEKIDPKLDERGHGNSGHVMMVIDKPGPPTDETVGSKTYRVVPIPVIDSSSVYHFLPELLPPRAGQSHRDGLGKGIIRLVIDQSDRVYAYWEGTYWLEGNVEMKRPKLSDVISFGRMVKAR